MIKLLNKLYKTDVISKISCKPRKAEVREKERKMNKRRYIRIKVVTVDNTKFKIAKDENKVLIN
jgi:hypothetical protein